MPAWFLKLWLIAYAMAGSASRLWSTGQVQVHTLSTNGNTLSAGANCVHLILSSGGLASVTVNFPASPVDKQIFRLNRKAYIITMTLAASGATIPSRSYGTTAGAWAWMYDQTDNYWYIVK